MEITRREFLESLPKTALKLSFASQALTGLAGLVNNIFAEEDYLSKLPDLNGKKVTEELIQEMLNVGSVKGILDKYGNKDNIFYVKFQPDGNNNLEDLVRKEPEKWDGSYVLVIGDNIPKDSLRDERIAMLRQSIATSMLSQKKNRVKFVLFDMGTDPLVSFDKKNERYVLKNNHFLIKLFGNKLGSPTKLLYTQNGKLLDGGGEDAPGSNADIVTKFTNEIYWLDHWLYNKWQQNETRENIIIRYNFSNKLKEEKR